MKRYKLHSVVLPSPQTGFKSKLFEDDQGDWAKYEDAKQSLLDEYHKGYSVGYEAARATPICNCTDTVSAGIFLDCPVHGGLFVNTEKLCLEKLAVSIKNILERLDKLESDYKKLPGWY